MTHRVGDIAAAIGATLEGDGDITITHAAEPDAAGPDALALAMSPKYAEALSKGEARAAIVWPGADWQAMGLEAAIIAPRARVTMAGLTRIFDPGQGFAPGIHPQALVDPGAEIGADVSIGPFSVIAAGARIGDRTTIGPLCYVGTGSVIGADSFLREHVSIGARVRTGARLVVQPGARIGSDGFSFVTPEKSSVEAAREEFGTSEAEGSAGQAYLRIHSLGGVEIGDDVEVGANTTIDSGTIRPTRIGNGTKLDNMVQVGHNVTVGHDTLLCGQVGLAGSCRVGNNVVLGGQVGAADNIFIGDGVVAAGATKITGNVPAGRVIMGYPATKMETQVAMYKAMRRLPRLLDEIARLQKAVFKSPSND
ncbi:UDP-3-O-(3-hydroxymyristoyl)glucosamine N-acyltransferase [Marinibacterium profundimaris]|uniref:UDP-3-O-acylglucosamine N-acyltransferase n=1 Tax=Marinibacterium profundimaris TaxID=1679460 RepID=A0A225NR28_9RHOB|nr:UDP-3-O-(3-hydroxymyristoyl)glucosamine N-acyltransferase [Marinibacterium profundimaris]OWU77335.1 UDP-3-O-(3-hydroxymyristoyl) glucosamine N-acyltransferase [Marinibacterium profundimaris]